MTLLQKIIKRDGCSGKLRQCKLLPNHNYLQDQQCKICRDDKNLKAVDRLCLSELALIWDTTK